MDRMRVSFLPVDHWRGPDPQTNAKMEEALTQRFSKNACQLFATGRAALDWLISSLGLRRRDEVWIVTSFDLPNVSSCVTCTIFNHCKPSRVLTHDTRAILVIHEFGVPHPRLNELLSTARRNKLPLIEDCAHTADSWQNGACVGTLGDWTILSFPKIIPVRQGGALVGPNIPPAGSGGDPATLNTLRSEISPHLYEISRYSQQRRNIFAELTRRALRYDLSPLFELTPGLSPWFFPVTTASPDKGLEFAASVGVDCARWHGSKVVVLPCHQCLTPEDVGQIDAVLSHLRG